ncbi:MAG: bifunctional protein HldE [Phycisphaerae bacterium]|nr:MAG: bifunctional protein HldE [Phycisphaerae bacterium]
MAQELDVFVKKAAAKRVLLVGDLILDRYVYGDAERISPEAPVPVLRVVERGDAVGGSGNVAACLKALGVEPVVCGVVGKDRHGKRLKSLLTDAGALCEHVVEVDDRPTITKTRFVGLAQHRHRQQLMRVDEEATTPLSDANRRTISDIAVSAVSQVDAVCIEDYDKGVVTAELVEAVVDAAKSSGTTVFVDPARLSDYSRYKNATVLTPNRAELAMVVGRTSTALEDIASDAEALRNKLGARSIVVTLDREGAVIVEQGASWVHVPTRPRSVYDNTGAGDAVLAMLATAVVGGATMPEAVKLANIAGGLEVEKFGCVPITSDEVLAELRLESSNRRGKLRSVDELVNELKLRRDRGETVVFTNGCFDILHAGHVDFLSRCRQEGSLLVVGLNSDASVKRQDKSDDRPINGELDRAAVLGGLASVDYVVLFEESTPLNLVKKVSPDVLAKGEDWADRGVVGSDFVTEQGGAVKLIPLLSGRSTTNVVEKIRTSLEQPTLDA